MMCSFVRSFVAVALVELLLPTLSPYKKSMPPSTFQRGWKSVDITVITLRPMSLGNTVVSMPVLCMFEEIVGHLSKWR